MDSKNSSTGIFKQEFVTNSPSGLSKVTDFGRNRKCVYGYLL